MYLLLSELFFKPQEKGGFHKAYRPSLPEKASRKTDMIRSYTFKNTLLLYIISKIKKTIDTFPNWISVG